MSSNQQKTHPRCVFYPKIPCYVREAMREAEVVKKHIEIPKGEEARVMYKVLDATAQIAAFEWGALASFCHMCTRRAIEDRKLIDYPTLMERGMKGANVAKVG